MAKLAPKNFSSRPVSFGFGLTVALFLALVALAMVFLSRANREFGRQSVERQAAQASSVLQAWVGGEDILAPQPGPDPRADLPDVMVRIRGFTVFNSRGQAGFSWGEAVPPPDRILGGSYDLSPQPFGDVVAWGRSSTVFYMKTEPGQSRMRMMRMIGPGDRGDRETERGAAGPGALLVFSFDGSEALGVMRVRQVLILALGGAALGLLAVLLLLFARIGRLQTDLEEHRALARLGTAARTLAHEVRNPLSIILMQAKLLERQLGEAHGDALRSICEEANRIELQVRNVKRILGSGSEMNPGKGRPAFVGSPGPWLDSLIAGFPSWEGKVSVTRFAGEKPGFVPSITDESLRSIVVNLVDNAMEASDKPGSVGIEWEIRDGRSPVFVLAVRDRAGGVPRELRRRIFEPFFTTKPGGSGVGLNLARELSRAAGGDLKYRFDPPAGSSFILTAPLFPSGEREGGHTA